MVVAKADYSARGGTTDQFSESVAPATNSTKAQYQRAAGLERLSYLDGLGVEETIYSYEPQEVETLVELAQPSARKDSRLAELGSKGLQELDAELARIEKRHTRRDEYY